MEDLVKLTNHKHFNKYSSHRQKTGILLYYHISLFILIWYIVKIIFFILIEHNIIILFIDFIKFKT